MTRDEAIEITFKNQAGCVKMSVSPKDRLMCAAADVDTVIALGMLKLDEPKSVRDRAFGVLDRGGHYAATILDELEASGLEIVEK